MIASAFFLITRIKIQNSEYVNNVDNFVMYLSNKNDITELNKTEEQKMKTISTMLVLLSAVCLGEMSLQNKDFSFKQNTNNTTFTTDARPSEFSLKAEPAVGGEPGRWKPTTGPVAGEQVNLWEPVTEIEDGSVYMIRCAENPNLYWDLTGGSLNNGTQVQLYDLNYSQAQKFYFKKSFEENGKVSYQLSPLYSFDKVLRFENKTENSILKIDDEKYSFSDVDMNLYSDKIYFTPSVTAGRFYAHTRFANSANSGDTYVSVQAASSGNKVKIKDSSLPSNRFIYSWEIIKTDYVGLNVGNKTYIDGTNEFRYVAKVPHPGRYVIETRTYGGVELDTYLRLNRDSTDTQVACNDDGGEGRNAKIVYNFTANCTDEHSIFVRGYNNNYHGYCYVILRPEKTIYLSSVFDYGHNDHDYTSHVNQAKPYLRNMGYFPVVQTNMHPDNLFYGTDWEGTRKVVRDYYIHRDHGSPRSAGYYNGKSAITISSNDLPSFVGTGVVAWVMCSGGNEYYSGISGHCPARQSVINGAQYSFGFRSNIYTLSGDIFVKKFCEALQTRDLESSIIYASQAAIAAHPSWTDDGIRAPSLFLNGGATEYRYTINSATAGDYTRATINYQHQNKKEPPLLDQSTKSRQSLEL